MSSRKGVAAMLAEAAKKARMARPPAGGGKSAGPAAPTPEQQRHMRYEIRPVVEGGNVTRAKAYQRHPWFMTLASRGDISRDDEKVLTYYRDAFEGSFYSEMRSSLDVGPGGGGGSYSPPLAPAEADAARFRYRLCEEGIASPFIDTLRAVALHDMRFTDIAIERFGFRLVPWIVDGKNEQRKAVKSGRHSGAIKEEFAEAVKMLAERVKPHLGR